MHWNKTLTGKQAWCIAMKADNLWVKWYHAMYIKDQQLSQFLPQNQLVGLLSTFAREGKKSLLVVVEIGWL